MNALKQFMKQCIFGIVLCYLVFSPALLAPQKAHAEDNLDNLDYEDGVLGVVVIDIMLNPIMWLWTYEDKKMQKEMIKTNVQKQTSLAIGIANGTVGDSAGLSWGFVLNYADSYKGIQWAPINYTKRDFLGWQAGFIDYVWGSMMGLQSGIVNYAGRVKGLEFGIVNYTDDVDAGCQIGLINIIQSNKSWFQDLPNSLAPTMILINW